MKPQAGGEYVYVRDALCPLAGFLYAWTWFLIAKPASIATITTGLVRILGTFPVLLSSRTRCSPIHSRSRTDNWSPSARHPYSWLNYIGVRKAGEFQFLFTLLKVATIVGMSSSDFSYSGGSWSNFATEFVGAKGGVNGFFLALVAALWPMTDGTTSTWWRARFAIRSATCPLALIWGVATVGLLYILVNAAVQYVLPAAVVAGSERPASEAVALVLGRTGAAWSQQRWRFPSGDASMGRS